LVRNPDLSGRWIRPGHPDHWSVFRGDWYSRAFPVLPGRRYEVGARDAEGGREIFVRLGDDPRMPGNAQRARVNAEGVFLATTRYAQLAVKDASSFRHAWARPSAAGP